ncbi:MAG: zf-HC2 domain-containing protein [Clostridia bacterium]|nr:zf-HC2 domain-containing protein [Clostridia bacterium]MBQ5812723.1 zf-HC2 domain-containing protein [Clostridia bacterium]
MKICSQNELLINMYIDGELSADEIDALEAHMAECPACRQYCEELRAMTEAMKDIEYPENLHKTVMAAVDSEYKAQKKKVISFRPLAKVAAAAAAVALAVFVGAEAGIVPGFGTDARAEEADCVMQDSAVAYNGALPETAYDSKSMNVMEVSPESPMTIMSTTLGWFTENGKDHVTVIDDASAAAAPEEETSESRVDELMNGIVQDLGSEGDGYGYYLLAMGSIDSLPAVFADQAEGAGAGYTLLISVKSDDKVREDISRSMSENGFEVYEVTEDEYFTCEPTAEEGLLIVCLDEE